MNIYTTSNRIAINNQSKFTPNKISALLLTLICVLTLAACAGGEPKSSMELDLRIIPDTTNATLIWNNPVADIANISISYKNSTAVNFEAPILTITDPDTRITANRTDVRGMIPEGSLTTNKTYTFRVALKFGGADVNKSIIAEEITRLIGPNLDQDEYADDDPLETDEDGDGTNDDIDAFPRNTTLSAFTVTELTARPGNGEVTLNWNNPAANIASISISYQRDDSVGQLMMNSSAQITPGEQNVQEIIDGLTNGQSYTFNVTLTLTGDDAAKKVVVASTTATPGTFSVTDLTAVPNDRSVTLSWNNPDADIAEISIRYGITGSSASTTVGASNTGRSASVEQTITDLTNGESYTFTVSLTLRDGAGKRVEAASDTATPNVFAVTDLTAIPNDRSVTLSWINPDADIASISISYKIDGSGASTTVGAGNTGRVASVEQTIDGLDNGVSYNFTVDLILARDYTGREGPALSIIVGIGPNLDGDKYADFVDNDDDNDEVPDTADVDADGDGLIEISTREQLDQIRYNLLGSSLNTSDGVAGDANGCGGLNGISDCNGYELTQNISLDGYNSDNWVPIGSCPTLSGIDVCTNVGVLFNATFDGNGYIISNLTITNPGGDYANAAGLFGAISPDSILRNVHIRSGNLNGGNTKVGLLVGYAREAMISNSSAEGDVAASGADVGGLVGFGRGASITSSYAEIGSVSGSGQVGGLVGYGYSATIMSSYAEVRTIIASGNYAGGLIGFGEGITITSSYVKVESIRGSRNIGGLVGGGLGAMIMSSYAETGAISGSHGNFGRIGGLVGTGDSATIMSSYAVTGPLSSTSSENTLGGLVGYGDLNAASSNSYWNNETSGITGGSVAGRSEGKTTDELQIPTDFIGIYATWATNMCDDGTAAWNLGFDDQYPALTCTPNKLTPQRP